MLRAIRSLSVCCAMIWVAPLAAQVIAADPQTQLRSPILTIDPERLYTESLFGQQVVADYRERSEALAAENRAIEQSLSTEEQQLTERRSTMSLEEFRALAETFDEKVQRFRAEQDQKQMALQAVLSEGRDAFLESITQDLAEIMVEAGAAVILDRRSVFLAAGLVDVTETAISEVNKTFLDKNSAPTSNSAQ